MSGGARPNAGRKKKPENIKIHARTFGVEKYILDWLDESYGTSSHALVRTLLKDQHDKELRESRRR